MALTNDQPTAKTILCDNCDSEEAALTSCNECGIFLCQFCTESHKRYRSTKHHKLLTMEELKSSLGPQKIAEKIRCPKHKEEVIKLFCKTCQTTICRDCTIVDHQGHKYGFVEEVAAKEKQHLQRSLNEVKQRKSRVVQGIVNLMKFSERLEAKRNSTVSEINQHFTELMKATESKSREMVQEATSLTNSKQKQIRAQLEVLEVALASCESSIEFTERAFRNGNDVQVLSMEKYIMQSFEQLKAVKDQTEPCVTEDMMFVIPSSVQETEKNLLKKYDIVVALASPGNCHTSFMVKTFPERRGGTFSEERKHDGERSERPLNERDEAETPMKVGMQYSITLICRDKGNRRLRCGGQDIKPLFTGMEVGDVAVTDNKDGSYTISFCPRQGGMLKFEVSINGVPAPNCSLTKQVKWVISDVHGKGVITDGGRTMSGEGRQGEYCCRVGGCYFESGVHTWKVRLSEQDNDNRGKGMYNQYQYGCQYEYHPVKSSVEVGIIDCNEINANIAQSKGKWVYTHSVQSGCIGNISLTLDMEKRTLNILVTNTWANRRPNHATIARNYQFTACRVSPFFACRSPDLCISLME